MHTELAERAFRSTEELAIIYFGHPSQYTMLLSEANEYLKIKHYLH
jgi:hypothetical protein